MKTSKKQKQIKNILYLITFGSIIGIITGFLGAGGGAIAIQILTYLKLSQKQAQATSLAIILPTTVVSFLMYLIKGDVNFNLNYLTVFTVILGGIFGTKILKSNSNKTLQVIFSIICILMGVEMFIC